MPVVDGKFVHPWRVPADKQTRGNQQRASALGAKPAETTPKAAPKRKGRPPGKTVTSDALKNVLSSAGKDGPEDLSDVGLNES